MKKQWWHGKVAYQIYPKSFNDTNGDGVGDLRGIIEKLDYLKDLGIDIVWISPMFTSPFVDQGYDISDYQGIAPIFGTMEDMDELIAEAKKRDMHILLDLVLNHCSDEHEWFQKALADLEGEYADYFHIVDEKEDGSMPSNWRSTFGGPTWTKIPGTNKYYLHIFAKEQPDVNWENPKLRQEMYDMINWWQDKGISGFRLDAIANIKKDMEYKSFPADREDGLVSKFRMVESVSGIEVFLKELKEKTFSQIDALTVAELSSFDRAKLEEYVGDDGYFSTIFDLSTDSMEVSGNGWYDRNPITANNYRQVIYDSIREIEGIGMKANIIENHDEPRGVSHYIPEEDCNDYSKKMLAAILFMRPGLPFLFQGQEIGMENTPFETIDEFDDLFTHNEYQVALDAGIEPEQALKLVNKYSRDNGRTPMQWNNQANGGFTTGTPWLKVNPNYATINVEDQLTDENSVWAFYQKLIALRKDETYGEAFVYGGFDPIFEDQDNIVAFYRRGEDKTILLLANFQNSVAELPFTEKIDDILINNYEELAATATGVTLQPHQAVIVSVD
ncbi:glycoside hydrolase family 13 protein [Enterococcus canintestini]|uniref:Alpha-glucosidase n=1 Tax=Enterococcus canintestini TaxID=317010 RepID=A0A267HR07_9ENTE|nr:alpha-glucosidase [Enterococcus canintestini]PAB00774.1 alpha-glucosidase [Enterococcus canintestini]